MIEERRPVAMIVEDDANVLSVVRDYLRADGFTVVAHTDGVKALRALQAALPDVLVLDRMLPGYGGDEVCSAIRAVAPNLPIIMLTALGSTGDRIDGLERGADDYLSKPFALRELLLRVNALIRRSRGNSSGAASVAGGPFRLDPVRRKAWSGDAELSLTPREYDLLSYFVRNPDRIISREEVLREVWDWNFGEASTVTVHVRRLREKIEDDPNLPRYLLTEWGAGYRFAVAQAA
ncbi:response regulator transcription factor [Leifsonia sp. fls2-241-R2A-40a]|uniref:response regulator transcription factor n=1 Tax=Leifsonia sp. fls2-241-R2A-40a TaxID=3040290 RepID=UPI00254BF8C7|nr:response regulator transcription factor [Leifsonia sp. fls2-241-R2A-40a]